MKSLSPPQAKNWDDAIMGQLANLLAAPIDAGRAKTDPAVAAFLNDLQANILKGHGRPHTGNIFLSFAGMQPAEVAAVLSKLGNFCTSAAHQLATNKRNPPHLDGGTVRCLFLSAGGYKSLGDLARMPAEPAFAAGMEAAGPALADPPRNQWNPTGWQGPAPDAMFMVADADEAAVTADLVQAETWLNGTGVTILVVERGLQQFRQFRPGIADGVEHFGYVDGRSQPLFLASDIAAEPHAHWDPAFPAKQFIVADPNGANPMSCGSYFVFRKLEQNVRGFNAAEKALGQALYGDGASTKLLDRAGAMVVGRFEDGTPLTQSCDAQGAAPPNDFTYAADADAGKCPFHAHIRKVNPRGDIERITGNPDPAPGRIRIMARRGITYGAQRPMTADKSDFADVEPGTEPTKDVGLLFMAYMASIRDQFEFTQHSWANNPAFAGNIGGNPKPSTGIDPVIGQSPTQADHKHTYRSNCPPALPATEQSFAAFVKLQGGEYFFAPSLSFLRNL